MLATKMDLADNSGHALQIEQKLKQDWIKVQVSSQLPLSNSQSLPCFAICQVFVAKHSAAAEPLAHDHVSAGSGSGATLHPAIA